MTTSMAAALERALTLGRRLALALAVALAAIVSPARAEPVYRFSPVNQFGIALTAAYWNPIIAYVSEKSGIKLVLRIGRTSAETTSYVLASEVEFCFTNHLFSPEREKLGWKVFASRNVAPISGQIVVPAESPISELAQLAGGTVAFAGPEAVVGYKFPYAQLLSKNIDVAVVFGGNHDGAFTQLFSGKVRAVGTVSALAEAYALRAGRKFRVLWTSEPVPELAFMVAPQVPEKVVTAVAEALIGMSSDPRGREVVRKASALVGLPDDAFFIAANRGEYEAYRRFYLTAPASLR